MIRDMANQHSASTSITATQLPTPPATDAPSARNSMDSSRSRSSSVQEPYEPSIQHQSATAPNTTVDPNAPPAYTGSGLSRSISKREYAAQLSRMMGKQLVKSVNGKTELPGKSS